MDRRKNIAVVTVALLALAGPRAHALQLVDLSPRGEVARVRQVVATFDEPAVDFGDPRAPAPFTVRRDDAQAGKGTPRWTGAKRWVFDFAAELPPGVRCTVERVAGFRSASGAALKAPERSCFDTGGPSVRTLWPAGGKIDERQTFVLELSGAATPASLREHVWCAADGPGERIPVALVEGAERDAVLQAVGRDKAARAEPSRFAALRCNRTLTAGGRVQVVYGQGGRDAPGRGQPRGAALRLRGPRTLRLRARERAGRVPAAAPHDAALQRAGHAGDRRAQPPRRPRRRPPAHRIAAPADGSIVALDPDIPPDRQRVRFAATGAHDDGLRWHIDGRLHARGARAGWLPWPGRHVVELVDATGRMLDRIRIEVRGAGLREGDGDPAPGPRRPTLARR